MIEEVIMNHKYKEFAIKSDGEKNAGTISGYFSTYDRIPDSYGDVIAPGAFTETIKKREESGHPFPLCWNHDPNQIIGKVDAIEDTEKGPLMTASFFDSPLAQEKRNLVKEGVVYQFSFAFDVLDAGPAEDIKANELRKLDLFEVSVVPIPANQNAVVTDIKSGRRNRKSDADILKQIRSLVDQLLEDEDEDIEADDSAKDQPKDNAEIEAKDQTVDNARRQKLLDAINNDLKEVNHDS